MNINAESHFAELPSVGISRSKLDKSFRHLTSFNVGDVVPVFCEEVLPGDTWQVDTSKVVRLQTLLTPMMDNIYLDTYYFFVPNRLVWSHWKEFMGENTESAWIPTTEYSVPQLTTPLGGFDVGTIADHLGFPTGVANLSCSALPFRGYALICNEWFRDQNLTDPLVISNGDADVVGSNGSSYVTDVAKGGMPFKASKYHDYFTSALPAAQKGPAVEIKAGFTDPWSVIPIKDKSNDSLLSMDDNPLKWNWWRYNQSSHGYDKVDVKFTSTNADSSSVSIPLFGHTANPTTNSRMVPSNLFAIPPASFGVASINELRLAFQIQKLFEKDARAGTRYTEVLAEHFGVRSPDSRLQRPEYLGGNRIPLTIAQVVQNSETSSTPQGNTTAYSLTTDNHSDFTYSATEHGFIFGLVVARYDHTYQQGIRRQFSRKTKNKAMLSRRVSKI